MTTSVSVKELCDLDPQSELFRLSSEKMGTATRKYKCDEKLEFYFLFFGLRQQIPDTLKGIEISSRGVHSEVL